MATIIVEDGSIVSGANSYLSEADMTTYASDRGVTLTATVAELLIQGMDFIEGLNYKGTKSTADQPLVWPRYDVYIDGYYIDNETIPHLLKDSLAEACIDIDNGNSPVSDVERATKKEKVGPIEVEYMDNASSTTYSRALSNKLSKLVRNSGGQAVVYRA